MRKREKMEISRKEWIAMIIVFAAILGFIVWQVADKLVYLSSLGWDKRRVLQWNEDHSFVYQDATYRRADVLRIMHTDGMELVSWSSLGYTYRYYAPMEEHPPFIFLAHGACPVYVREDFDYLSIAYRLEDTEQIITIADLTTGADPRPLQGASHITNVELFLPAYDACALFLNIYRYAGAYYIVFYDASSDAYHPASEQLVQLLKDHGIIEAP